MRVPKVAMMTWYTYRNYGTALQASALYHVIENMGYKPYLVNYLPKGNQKKNSIKELVCRVLRKIGNRNRQDQLLMQVLDNTFDKYLKERIEITHPCRSYSELHDLNGVFDAFVCGSDQIWSPLCYDDKYFLSFVENSDKMLAYAPSMPLNAQTDTKVVEKICGHISRFKHLSVREKQLASNVERLTGKKASVVLDPTLLLSPDEWDSYAKVSEKYTPEDGGYIACYFLGNPQKYMKYVRSISKRMKIPFYVIPITGRQRSQKEAVPYEVGPSEFVTLLRNAKYVCTDSFHGMAFAINYNVPFSVFKRFSDGDPKNQNDRIISLLEMLHLESRLVEPTVSNALRTVIECDFALANNELQAKRVFSLNYLRRALNSAVSACGKKSESVSCISNVCCGCGACSTVCSMDAITIKQDQEGFNRCFIDEAKCAHCRKCMTVCPMIDITAEDLSNSKFLYSARSISPKVLENSSSGGIGHELALHLQQQGMYICGCVYDNEGNTARHVLISPDDKEKLILLQGSKYIQSETENAFGKIAQLSSKNKIAFFGTPCQTAAVDKLLRIKGRRDNAILIDLICHGVPSRHLWMNYLESIMKRFKVGGNPKVLFRNNVPAQSFRTMLIAGNGRQYTKDERQDDFYAFFRRSLCDMRSCSECPYREKSSADIRIGDYWGEKHEDNPEGISMVISNTDRAEQVLNMLYEQDKIELERQSLEEYWSIQYPYNRALPIEREEVLRELREKKASIHNLRIKYCMYYDFCEWIMRIYKKLAVLFE